MTEPADLAQALAPLTTRVRTDITARRRAGEPAVWTRQPLTEEMLLAHLDGGPARGVCPIRAGESTTCVGLLDFDSHKGETSWPEMSATVARVVEVLEDVCGLAPILFRSSGGRGVHLYLLWDEPQDAYSVRELLRGALTACGLRSGTGGVVAGEVEVYPKQDSVAQGRNGNMFILPLAGQSEALTWDADDEEDLW